MEIVTNIIAAEEEEYTAIGDSACPLDEWSGIEANGLDTLKIATLHCLLTSDSLQMALDLYEPVYVSVNETVVLRMADELLEHRQQLLGIGIFQEIDVEHPLIDRRLVDNIDNRQDVRDIAGRVHSHADGIIKNGMGGWPAIA